MQDALRKPPVGRSSLSSDAAAGRRGPASGRHDTLVCLTRPYVCLVETRGHYLAINWHANVGTSSGSIPGGRLQTVLGVVLHDYLSRAGSGRSLPGSARFPMRDQHDALLMFVLHLALRPAQEY